MSNVRKSSVVTAKPVNIAQQLKSDLNDAKVKIAELTAANKELEESLAKAYEDLDEVSKSDEVVLEEEIIKRISDDIGTRIGQAVVEHIAHEASKTFRAFPAAKSISLNFNAKDLIWTDPNSLQRYVIEQWKKQLAGIMQISITELDEVIRVSVIVPEIRTASRIRRPAANKVVDISDGE